MSFAPALTLDDLPRVLLALHTWGRGPAGTYGTKLRPSRKMQVEPHALALFVVNEMSLVILKTDTPEWAAIRAARTLLRLLPGADDALLLALVRRVVRLNDSEGAWAIGRVRLGLTQPFLDRPWLS